MAAMNPCTCGYYSDPRKPCKCWTKQIDAYFARVSGPLLDRIDIHVTVPAVPFEELRSRAPGTASSVMREEVLAGRVVQRARFGEGSTMLNARMGPRRVREHCPLDSACETLLKQAMTELGLSARAHDKVLRLSRTIADLAGEEAIKPEHLSEAVHYRRLDRQN